jgi:hypothetical protein
MNGELHAVLDDSAMVTAGRSNATVSRLIHRAHTQTGWYLYAPACALVEADRARPGTAEHIAALPAITVLPLDLPAALAIAQEPVAGWAAAHTGHSVEPTAERPDGAFVATAAPDLWKGRPVRVLDVHP